MWSLDAIRRSEWFRAVSATADSLEDQLQVTRTLRAELAQAYDAQDVGVYAYAVAGVPGNRRLLVVNFLDPTFFARESSDQRDSAARKVAESVVSLGAPLEGYDLLAVTFAYAEGAASGADSTTVHSFDVAELVGGGD